jgi:hypothetical protein
MPGCNLLLDGLDESGSGSFGVKANDEANFTPPSLGPNVNGAHGVIVSSVCVKCCNKSGNETMRNVDRECGHSMRVVGQRLRQASRDHIGVPDGLDFFESTLLDSDVETLEYRREHLQDPIGEKPHVDAGRSVTPQCASVPPERTPRNVSCFDFASISSAAANIRGRWVRAPR